MVGLGESDFGTASSERNDVVCDVDSLVQKATWKPARRNDQQTYHNGGRTVAKKKAAEGAAPAAATKKAATKKAATKKAAPEGATKKAATKKAATKKAAVTKGAVKKKKK